MPFSLMTASPELLTIEGGRAATDAFAADIVAGLSRTPKSLPSKYFYDETGSRLFQQITKTEEYYLTRCEAEILHEFRHTLGDLMGCNPFRLVELGVGDASKTGILLRHFLQRGLEFQYVPVDICGEAMNALVSHLRRQYVNPQLPVCGLAADYFDALRWLKQRSGLRSLVLFLGSSIGNFNRPQTRRFLLQLQRSLNPGDRVLLGFDLKKDAEILHRAYNDAAGVTRRFNLNLLERINQELDGNFDSARFQHHGYYNAGRGRMESWLISTCEQTVWIGQVRQEVFFRAWEGMHVENSYKYDLADIERLAAGTGFTIERHLLDSQGYFVDSLWRVRR